MEEEIGISIEVENYRVYRADNFNIVVQLKRYKVDSMEFYWVTEGYYSTEQQALIALFRKVTKAKHKAELKDIIISIREAEASILQAIQGLKL
jgi:hypothetical protein